MGARGGRRGICGAGATGRDRLNRAARCPAVIYSISTSSICEYPSMQIIRSLLFVPGNRAHMLDKATGLKPDAVVPDMEDSVPRGEKRNARRLVASYLRTLAEAGHRIIPRVNALNTGLMEDDLRAVIGPYIYGVSVGKVGSAEDVRRVADTIGRMEIEADIPFGSVSVVPWVETASAIVHAHAICTASKRVAAVAFGGEDLTNDMGIQRTKSEREVEYPRRVAAVAARAARVLALDTPYFDYRDTDGLKRNSVESRNLGFQGRFAIHPSQIETINAAYAPSAAEIEQAQRVVAAFEEAERRGSAATSLDGMVIDVPVVERARKALDAAKQDSN